MLQAQNYGEHKMTSGKQLFSTLADGKLTVEIVETNYSDPTGNQVLQISKTLNTQTENSSQQRYYSYRCSLKPRPAARSHRQHQCLSEL